MPNSSSIHGPDPRWERPESVHKFAGREPSARLLALLDGHEDPAEVRVCDLGCGGGRNTAVLAERDYDFHARDASRAMVEHTRARVEAILGQDEADRRVKLGSMAQIDDLPSSSFSLIVALGVYHCAGSQEEWMTGLMESARVLAPGGRLLLSSFTPECEFEGEGLQRVAGEAHVYTGSAGGRFLVDATTLEAEMARHGLAPCVPSRTTTTLSDGGRRVVLQALYEKSRPELDIEL